MSKTYRVELSFRVEMDDGIEPNEGVRTLFRRLANQPFGAVAPGLKILRVEELQPWDDEGGMESWRG